MKQLCIWGWLVLSGGLYAHQIWEAKREGLDKTGGFDAGRPLRKKRKGEVMKRTCWHCNRRKKVREVGKAPDGVTPIYCCDECYGELMKKKNEKNVFCA